MLIPSSRKLVSMVLYVIPMFLKKKYLALNPSIFLLKVQKNVASVLVATPAPLFLLQKTLANPM